MLVHLVVVVKKLAKADVDESKDQEVFALTEELLLSSH
jgi:hypothetical protein